MSGFKLQRLGQMEEVLVVRVHPEVLRSQGLSEELRDEKTIWEERYRSIVDLEEHLHRNGTRVIKFFLHLSKKEQRKRFLERIDEPDKNWKFSLSDIHERKYWEHYMKAYEACLNATSTHHAPWYVVPADDKEKENHMELGMIGLGRMGTNMVRRLQRAGHQCVVYDVQPEAVHALAKEGAVGTTSLEDFANKLKLPRTVWMMAPAPVLSAALYERFSSRGEGDFADKVLSALRYQFGGQEEKAAPKKGGD